MTWLARMEMATGGSWQLTAHGLYGDCTMSQPRESRGGQEDFQALDSLGPPEVLVCDGERGLGASEVLTEKLSVSGTQVLARSS